MGNSFAAESAGAYRNQKGRVHDVANAEFHIEA
jgi:hypothetical protein